MRDTRTMLYLGGRGDGEPGRIVTMAGPASGQLVVSIDLELENLSHSLAKQKSLDALTSQLVAELGARQMPATFAVADPVLSAATDTITQSAGGHELAVLADATWAGPGAGRERFARELARRFDSARAAGLNVSTLALRHLEMEEHFDLLPKNAISAVRTDPVSRRGLLLPPQVLRFGVWQLTASLRLPQSARWWLGGSESAARGLLKQAVKQGHIVHLLIDAPQLLENEGASLRSLQRTLNLAAKLRDAGELEIATLQSVTANLSRPRHAAALRSILRAA